MSLASTTSPRVLYSLPDGAQSGVLLRTSLFARLTAAHDVHWTFVSPLGGDAELLQEFRDGGADLIPWPTAPTSKSEHLLFVLRQELWRRRVNDASTQIYVERSRWFAPKRYLLQRYVVPAIARLPGIERIAEGCDARWLGDGGWNEILQRVRPDVVVLGSATVKPQEIPLARAARRAGLSVFGVVPSWDNLTTKGVFCRADRLSVWNESMRHEAVQHFGYTLDDVVISGPPPFDAHHVPLNEADRLRFFAERGLDPARKLLTYAGVPKISCPFGHRYVELLADLIAGDRFGEPCQLLVRLHPQDDPEQYENVAGRPHVCVERAGTYRGPAGGLSAILQYKPTRDDTRRLTETLAFSDALINVNSTVTIEACRLDCPTINLGFNPPGAGPFLDIGTYLQTTHFAPVIESQATDAVYSVEELIAATRRVLQHPGERATARARLYRQFDPFNDGRAADRLAEQILQFVRETRPSDAALPRHEQQTRAA
jgi:hypothetical protein